MCHLELVYDIWSSFAPLSLTKMLWRTIQVSEFKLHPKYDVIPHPRRGDYLIIEFALEQGIDKEEILDISTVR